MSTGEYTTDAERWDAVRNREARADGCFVYAVKTTGIYCRPLCSARLPHRQNVEFFASPEAAARHGFRPCLRCKPKERNGQVAAVERACRSFENAADVPSLEELAAAAGLSSSHFHRVFKTLTGVTPRAYFTRRRAQAMQHEIRRAQTITEAIYSSGFNASSRFYTEAPRALGMSPSLLRKGGEGLEIRFAVRPCSLGLVLIAATERGVCSIALGDDVGSLRTELTTRFPKAVLTEDNDGLFADWVAAAVALVDDPGKHVHLPLDIQGTAFQQRVWKALRTIPAGETRSYSQVADLLDAPSAVRAVAAACGSNPVAVAVPCHRVVGKDGELHGYRWGTDRKRELLRREAKQSGPLK